MPSYGEVSPDVLKMRDDIIKKHHSDLREEEVTVGVMFAYGRTAKSGKRYPALLSRGRTCLAKVRVNSEKERAQGLPDATVLLDGDAWPNLDAKRRKAVLDHEITHLALVRSARSDQVKFDGCGRPKLKMRLHDHEFGWFDSIAERYGEDSVEVRQAKHLVEQHGQLYFGFAQPEAA